MGQKNDIINNLEHEIEQKQSQIQKLVLEQSTQEQQKDELRMENQRLTTDCHANFNKLQIKTKEYELSIEESNLKYHQSQEVAGQLKNQIEILNLQIETFNKECNEYRQTINDLQKHHQRFNNEKNQTETQLHKLQDQSKHQKESLENQLKELNQLLFQKNDEIQIWSDKCLSQQKRTAVEKEELIQKFKDQNLQINELNLRIQQVTNQRDELRDVRIINLEKQLSQYENKLNETQDKLESTLENHREMTLKQQSLTKEYNAISLDNVKYGELNNSLNEQLITLRETVTELQKDIILKDEQLLVIDEQQQLLDILKKEFSKKYHELEDKNNYLQDENHRLQGQLKQNFKDVTIVRAKNDEQTNLLIKLNQQMGENNNLNEQQSNMIIKLSSQLDLDKQIIEDLNEKISIFTIFFKDIHNNLRDHYLIDTKLESERLYKILYEVSILGNHHLISLSQETQIAEKLQFYLKNLMKIHQNHQILWEKFNKFYVVNVINGPQGSINEFRSSSLNRHTTSKQSQNRSLSSFSYEYEQASTQQSTKISSPKSQKKILESVQQMLKINSPSLAANRVKQLLKYEKFAQLVTDSMLICYPLGHFDSRPSIMEVWKWFKNILYSYESLSYDSVQLKKFLDNGNHSLLEVSSPKNTFTSFTNDKTKNLERILNKVRIILEQDSLNDLESFLDSELVQKEKMAS